MRSDGTIKLNKHSGATILTEFLMASLSRFRGWRRGCLEVSSNYAQDALNSQFDEEVDAVQSEKTPRRQLNKPARWDNVN
jgi:hypothetical protein